MDILILLVILLFSAVLHEIMHGVVALKLGDPTAKLLGRLTLNPIPHIDPVMTILVPALFLFASGGNFFFAGAKPVPVNPIHFRDPKKDMALVALAGPLTNLLIAILGAALFKIAPDAFFQTLLFLVVKVNLMLAIFNLIPIPPLDGSKIFTILLPDDIARSYLSMERYGPIILVVLLFGPFPLGQLVFNLVSFSLHLLGL